MTAKFCEGMSTFYTANRSGREGLQLLAQGVITVAVEVEEAEVAKDLELLADFVGDVETPLQRITVGESDEHRRGVDQGASRC